MKKNIFLLVVVMAGCFFVGCDISIDNIPKTIDVTVEVCGKSSLKYLQIQDDVVSEVSSIVVVMKNSVTQNDIECVVATVCLKYGVDEPIEVSVDEFCIEIKIGVGENYLDKRTFQVIVN